MAIMQAYSRGNEAFNVPRIVRVVPTQTQSFSWVKEGNLFYVSLGPEGGGYLYRIRASGALMVVTNDIDKTNMMLRNELHALADGESFIKEFSASVFLSFFAPAGSDIIDSSYVANWLKYKTIKRYGCSAEALEESAKFIDKYASEPKILITNGDWREEYYVVLANGGIEQWVMNGHVHPFNLTSLEKTKIENEGTIVPLPEVGGNIRLKEEPPKPPEN